MTLPSDPSASSVFPLFRPGYLPTHLHLLFVPWPHPSIPPFLTESRHKHCYFFSNSHADMFQIYTSRTNMFKCIFLTTDWIFLFEWSLGKFVFQMEPLSPLFSPLSSSDKDTYDSIENCFPWNFFTHYVISYRITPQFLCLHCQCLIFWDWNCGIKGCGQGTKRRWRCVV